MKAHKVNKVSNKVRVLAMKNLYKLMKNKHHADNLEKHIYKMSSGHNGAYVDMYRKIMIIIVPKRLTTEIKGKK